MSAGKWIDAWWDRRGRVWVIELKDADGNTIGPDPGCAPCYEPTREKKDAAVAKLREELAREDE